MSFRSRQKYINAGYSPVCDIEERVLESGEMIKEMIDQSEKVLPPPELFDLKNQLEAGVDMEEVNPTLFKPKSVDFNKVVRKYTKKKVENVDSDN